MMCPQHSARLQQLPVHLQWCMSLLVRMHSQARCSQPVSFVCGQGASLELRTGTEMQTAPDMISLQ